MKLDLFEKIKVYIDYYPGAEKLNPKLHDIILKRAKGYNNGAPMTGWNEGLFISEFGIIGDYVLKIIQGFDKYTHLRSPWKLELKDLWGQYYNKDDYQVYHHHNPNYWSFVYYVNAPKGSAPLVFTNSKKKVIPKSGMIVLFPSWLYHHVPKHRSEEIRSVISGNLLYTRDWERSGIDQSGIDQSNMSK